MNSPLLRALAPAWLLLFSDCAHGSVNTTASHRCNPSAWPHSPYNPHWLALTPRPPSRPLRKDRRSAWAAPPRQLDND